MCSGVRPDSGKPRLYQPPFDKLGTGVAGFFRNENPPAGGSHSKPGAEGRRSGSQTIARPHQGQRGESPGIAASQWGQRNSPGNGPMPVRVRGRAAVATGEVHTVPERVRTRNRDGPSASETRTGAELDGSEFLAGEGQVRQSRTRPRPSSLGQACIGSPQVGQIGASELDRSAGIRISSCVHSSIARMGLTTQLWSWVGAVPRGLDASGGETLPIPWPYSGLRTSTTLPTVLPGLAS